MNYLESLLPLPVWARVSPSLLKRLGFGLPWLVPLPGFVILALLSFPPFIYAVYLSLINVDLGIPDNPTRFVGLANYAVVMGTSQGLHALGITLLVSFASTILCVLIGLVTAYLIEVIAGQGALAGFLVVLVLIPLAVSPVAMALVFSLILDPLYGPIPQIVQLVTGSLIAPTSNAWGAVVTIIVVQTWQWSPLAVVLFIGGLRGIPKDPIEAARIDGAQFWSIVWRIQLPLLRPLLAVVGIFEFILCSQAFAATNLLTNGGPGRATVDLSLFIYKVGISESGQVSVASAAGVLELVLGLVTTAVWLKVVQWEKADK